MEWYLEKLNSYSYKELRQLVFVHTKTIKAPKCRFKHLRGKLRKERAYALQLMTNSNPYKFSRMELKTHQAGAILQLHQWANECVATEHQPVVMITLSINSLNQMQIAAHAAQGAEPEQVLQVLEAAYKGYREQLKKTSSGIIKHL